MAERRGGGGGEQALTLPGGLRLFDPSADAWLACGAPTERGLRATGLVSRRGPRCQLRHTWSELGRKVLEIGLDQTEDRAAQVSLMDFGIKSEHKSPEMPRIK